MAKAFLPSAAVLKARERRAARLGKRDVEIQWFIDNVSKKVSLSMRQRVAIATEMTRDQVVRNISKPVVKGQGAKGQTVVLERSKAGEFPRADTTQLMKSIFKRLQPGGKGVWDGIIGTPLDYGLILETKKDRSFLQRTLNEMRVRIKQILTGPIR